jgi:hypothetical protein
MKLIKWLLGVFLVISLVVLISFLGFKPSDEIQTKKINSESVETSKNQGYFIAEYKAVQDKIKLKHHADSVEFYSLWFEVERTEQFVEVFNGKAMYPIQTPTDSLYFQIDFWQCCSDDFIFEITGHGSRNGRGTFDSKELPDTIHFGIIERNPEKAKAWKEYLKGQQISFVKLKK